MTIFMDRRCGHGIPIGFCALCEPTKTKTQAAKIETEQLANDTFDDLVADEPLMSRASRRKLAKLLARGKRNNNATEPTEM